MFIVECNSENEHDGDDCISISQSSVSVSSGRKTRIKFTEADVYKIWSKFRMLITGNEPIKEDRVRNVIQHDGNMQELLAKYRLHRLTEKVLTERKAFKKGKLWILEVCRRTQGNVKGWRERVYQLSRPYYGKM